MDGLTRSRLALVAAIALAMAGIVRLGGGDERAGALLLVAAVAFAVAALVDRRTR